VGMGVGSGVGERVGAVVGNGVGCTTGIPGQVALINLAGWVLFAMHASYSQYLMISGTLQVSQISRAHRRMFGSQSLVTFSGSFGIAESQFTVWNGPSNLLYTMSGIRVLLQLTRGTLQRSPVLSLHMPLTLVATCSSTSR
jgi:hypothetical protein